LAHGTPVDPLWGSVDLLTAPEAGLRHLAEVAQADCICLGQTHVPALRRLGRVLFLNPGSLGLPLYGVPDPTYAVWSDGDVRIHHLHYDTGITRRKLALLPLDPDVADRLGNVLQTGLAGE
jgi:predicted phosphodiesterase